MKKLVTLILCLLMTLSVNTTSLLAETDGSSQANAIEACEVVNNNGVLSIQNCTEPYNAYLKDPDTNVLLRFVKENGNVTETYDFSIYHGEDEAIIVDNEKAIVRLESQYMTGAKALPSGEAYTVYLNIQKYNSSTFPTNDIWIKPSIPTNTNFGPYLSDPDELISIAEDEGNLRIKCKDSSNVACTNYIDLLLKDPSVGLVIVDRDNNNTLTSISSRNSFSGGSIFTSRANDMIDVLKSELVLADDSSLNKAFSNKNVNINITGIKGFLPFSQDLDDLTIEKDPDAPDAIIKNVCEIRDVDPKKDADVLEGSSSTEGFVIDCGETEVFKKEGYQFEGIDLYIKTSVEAEETTTLKLVVANETIKKVLMTTKKVFMPDENMPLLDTTITPGTYITEMRVQFSKPIEGGCEGPAFFCKDYEYLYYEMNEYEFEANHKTLPTIDVSADDEGLNIACSGDNCEEWATNVYEYAKNYSKIEMIPEKGGTWITPSNDPSLGEELISLEKDSSQENGHILKIAKDYLLSFGISESDTFRLQVYSYGFPTYKLTNLKLPFYSKTIDSSKLSVKEVMGDDGEPVMQIICSDTSDEYREWMNSITALSIEGTGAYVGVPEGSSVKKVEGKLILEIPNNVYGMLTRLDRMNLLIVATGYIKAKVEDVKLEHFYHDYDPQLSATVVGSGLQIHAVGTKGKEFLEAMTVYPKNEEMIPYIHLYAENGEDITNIMVKNKSKSDTTFSLSNIKASDYLANEDTIYTLLVPMEKIAESGEFLTGTAPIRVRMAAYHHKPNKMIVNVLLYPVLKIVTIVEDANKNDTDLPIEDLEELDGYLNNDQIENVTVKKEHYDNRYNKKHNVDIVGQYSAVIMTDKDGKFSTSDLDYDKNEKHQVKITSTIAESELTDDEIKELLDELNSSGEHTQNIEVYDDLSFDIKLAKDDENVSEIAMSTAIIFEIPDDLTLGENRQLKVMTVHNGEPKYLDCELKEIDGVLCGVVYTSEFSSFIPVLVEETVDDNTTTSPPSSSSSSNKDYIVVNTAVK